MLTLTILYYFIKSYMIILVRGHINYSTTVIEEHVTGF